LIEIELFYGIVDFFDFERLFWLVVCVLMFIYKLVEAAFRKSD